MLVEPRVELKLLHSFVVVSETLHFGRAAERSFVSVGTISTRIKDLEQRLGYPVFERSSREVALTGKGAELLDEVKPLLTALSQVTAHPKRKISVAVNNDAITIPITAALDRLRAGGADVDVQWAYDDKIVAGLEAETVDLAIGWTNIGNASRVSIEVGTFDIYLLHPPGDPIAGLERVAATDVADRRVVLFDRELGPGAYDRLVEWLEHVPRTSTDYTSPVVQSQSGMAVTAAAREGTITFGTQPSPPGGLVAKELDPSMSMPVWASARSDDLALLTEFVELVNDY